MLSESGQPLSKYCVIGEPTDLKPIREHKGIMMESIRFIGSSGHSSNPQLGNSALEGMLDYMQRLLDYRQQLEETHQNPSFDVATPTMNLGHIHGGDNPNRICGDCELHIDLRFLPGMDYESLRNQIHRIGRTVAEHRDLKVEFKSLFNGVPAMHTDPNSALNEYLQQMTSHKSQSVAFATEAPFYNEMGCETIVLGPGSIKQAHQPDEYLPADQIKPTVTLLENLIQRFCCT